MEQRLGPYLILETIGRGAAGKVFRARSPEGREVALKLLIGTLSPEALGRFERERSILSQLGHDLGFVPLLDAGTSPHGPYVVMDLMHGGSLRDRLQRTGRLDLASGIELGADLASALAAAHARGVVHRDLKPGNILFTREGGLRVADLGLAKTYQDTKDSLSRTGVLRGTIGYMPPEQMLDAKRAGPPADVFAWGAVLYEALTGEPPFGNGPPMEVVYNLETGKFPPIRERSPEVPAPLGALIGRCLASDSSERPQDGAALVAEFAAATASARETPRKGGPLLLALGALLLLGAGIAIGANLSGTPAASPSPSSPPATAQRGESPAPSPSPQPSASPSPQPSPSPAPTSAPPPADSPPPPAAARTETARTPLPRHLGKILAGRRLKLRALLGDYKGRHLGLVTDVAWGPSERYLATVELAGWIRLWKPGTGAVIRSYRTPQRLHTVDTGPGAWGVVGGDEGAVLIRLEGETGLEILPKRGKCVAARFVAPDRVAATEGTSLTIYEVPSGREVWRVEAAHPGEGDYVNGLYHVAARDEIVTGQRSLRVWSAKDGKLLRTFSLPEGFAVEDIAVTPGGERIFVSGQVPRLLEFMREGPDEFAALDLEKPGYTRSLAMLPSGALFTGHDDGTILFRARGAAQVGRHAGWIHALRVSPSLVLASVGNDAQLHVWTSAEPNKGPAGTRRAWSPSGHQAPVEQLEVRGQRVYTRGRDGLRVWDRASARQLGALPPELTLGRRAAVMLAISPSGQRVLRLGIGLAVDDLDGRRLLSWNNKDPNSKFWHASFVDEDTLSLVNMRGEEFSLDLATKRSRSVPRQGTLLALRWVAGLGWVRVFTNRLEVETREETIRSRLDQRPDWAQVDPHGTIVLSAKGWVAGVHLDRETGRFRRVQTPYVGQLTCLPAFSPGLQKLALADQRGLVLLDLGSERAQVVDQLDLSLLGERICSLAWRGEGELWAGSAYGPALCYDVR